MPPRVYFPQPKTGGQTVLPDRSLLKELNWVGKAQLKNSNETWGVTSQQYGSWERWKGVVVVKVSYDMQINQHNGAGKHYLCAAHWFSTVFYFTLGKAADDTGLL